VAKDVVVTSRLIVPASELLFSFARSSGPGGQNVNKVNSKAVLRWNVVSSTALPDAVRERFQKRFGNRVNERGELVLTSDKYRDQGRNITDCLTKLREMLRAVAAPPRRRIATKPTKGAKESRLKTKREDAEKKSRRRPPSVGE
jgi:ribosome-associated protein